MSTLKLSSLEIKELIDRYKSELRKLQFQVSKTRTTIQELEIYIKEAKAAEAAPPKRKPGRPRKAAAVAAPAAKAAVKEKPTKGKRGRPKGSGKPKLVNPPKAVKGPTAKKELKRNHKLNEWDNLLLEGLRNKGKSMINVEFWDLVQTKNQNDGLKWSDTKVRAKLNQSLHKLANKRGVIVKVPYSGKGFAYALQDWFNSKGNLPKKYNY